MTIAKYLNVRKLPKEHQEQVKLLEKIVTIPHYKKVKKKEGQEENPLNKVGEAVEVSQARPCSEIKSLI